MYTFRTQFDELLRRTLPAGDRLELAKELPSKIRAFLEAHQDFPTIEPHSRLAGSYAQKTSVGDIKDVDFLVRIDGDPEACDPKPSQVISDLCKVLDELPKELGLEGFAQVDVERARRSVHVYIPAHDFHLDVVPCIALDGFAEPLYVPDRGWGKWIPSHPLGFVEYLNELNNENGQKVKRLIRLLKHFRNYHMVNRRPKSYWLSVLVLQELDELDQQLSSAELFRDLLTAIHCRYDHLLSTSDTTTPNLKDPILGHNVSWNWSRTHFETFMRRLDEGRIWAEQALEEDNRDKAVRLWQKVFGEEFFPAAVDEATQALADKAWPGRAFVTSTGLVTAAEPATGTATQSRPTTFHGEIET